MLEKNVNVNKSGNNLNNFLMILLFSAKLKSFKN